MKQQRIYAFLIDLLIIAVPFVSGVLVGVFVLKAEFLTVLYPALASGLLILLLKDLAGGRSPGKYFMGLRIDHGTNKSVLVFRNIPLIVFPLEGLVFLFQDKRIGDMLFKTQVVTDENSKFNRNTELLAGVLIALAFVYLSAKNLAGFYVRQRQEYLVTEAFIYGSKAIKAKTGQIIKIGKVPSYNVSQRDGQTMVKIQTDVYGEKENAELIIYLVKKDEGDWTVKNYEYKEKTR